MTAAPLPYGMTWHSGGPDVLDAPAPADDHTAAAAPRALPTVNTRSSLWPTRWPAIALQTCIDQVEAAPVDEQAAVKLALPCHRCEAAPRCLNAKRKELGPLSYGRELLTRAISSEASLFPRTLTEALRRTDVECVGGYRKPLGVSDEYVVGQAWDIAWSEKIGGDYLVCMTAVVHVPTGRRRLLDIERWRQLGFDEQIAMVVTKWAAYAPDVVVIETDAAQQVWAQRAERTTPVPVMRHAAGGRDGGKRSLAAGVPSLLINLHRWVLPGRRESLRITEVDNFIDEAEAFSWVEGKLEGVGEHDDTVMAFWHLNYGLDRLVPQWAAPASLGLNDGAAQ